jgi:hypothetical protein
VVGAVFLGKTGVALCTERRLALAAQVVTERRSRAVAAGVAVTRDAASVCTLRAQSEIVAIVLGDTFGTATLSEVRDAFAALSRFVRFERAVETAFVVRADLVVRDATVVTAEALNTAAHTLDGLRFERQFGGVTLEHIAVEAP